MNGTAAQRLAYYDAIFEVSGLGIITMDADGTIEASNSDACDMLGYSAEALVGKPVASLLNPQDVAELGARMHEFVRSGIDLCGVSGRTVYGLHDNGHRVPLLVQVIETSVEGRRRFTAIMQDLTAVRLLEQRLRDAKSLESLGRRAQRAAHDLNNALHGVRMLTDLVCTELEKDRTSRPWAEQLQASVQEAARIAEDLHERTRDPSTVEVRSVDLNEVIRGLAGALRQLVPARIELEMNLEPTPILVSANPQVLERVALDLVLGARDSMGSSGSTIRIATRGSEIPETPPSLPSGRYQRLSVEDDGPGMSEEARRDAVARFFAKAPTMERGDRDLAAVFDAVRAARGSVELTSQPGGGSSVAVLWPSPSPEG